MCQALGIPGTRVKPTKERTWLRTSAQPRSCAFVYSVCTAWMPFTPEFNPRSSPAATVDCHIPGCLLLLFLPQTELAPSRPCALLVFAQTSSSTRLSVLGLFVLAAGFPCTSWVQDSPCLCVSSTWMPHIH